MSLMDKILAVCMPPPEKDGKPLGIEKNEMKEEVLYQTYSDGTVGQITMADDEKEPQNFVIVTRKIETDGQTQTSTLKKSKDGFKMKDTNIFNCFDAKLAEAEKSGGSYKGSFSTTQIKEKEVTRYTREHDNGKETFIKSKVENFQTDDEKVTELEKTEPTKFASAAECKAALSKFTGMEIPA